MPTLLLIGGHTDAFSSLREAFAEMNASLVETGTAATDALRAARATRPDVALVDIGGPIDALETAVRVRTGLRVPFVHVVGEVDDDRIERARACEPDGWIDALASRRAVRGTLEVALRRRDARRRRAGQAPPARDRLSPIGPLTAAIAHEINNPLTWVVANLGFAVDALDEERRKLALDGAAQPRGLARTLEAVVASLEQASDGAERIRRMVADLRSFARPDELDRAAVDVREVLDMAVRVCGNEIRHRARLRREYTEVPPVHANPAQLGQALLNLVVNAAQAIPLGNRDANEIVLVARRDDEDSVRVEVRDTGVGIPPEHLDRVFEPFFTTRPLGTASGMGLAVAMGLVTDHGGTLAVESRVGAGSTFRVHLPAHHPVGASPPARRSPPPPTSPLTQRRARVVVIDDEPLVLDVIRRILEADHDVRVDTDPRAALAELLSGEPADVVLCDLMMPELTGMDVFEAIERARPALAPHVVFMSGCAFSDRALGLLRRTSNLRLDKPFDTVTLLEAIRSLTR